MMYNLKRKMSANINQDTKFLVLGGVPLKGRIKISSAKNALLPLLAALIVTKDKVTIPYSNIIDINNKLKILEGLGYEIEITTQEVHITPPDKIINVLHSTLIQSIRSSILFFGPLLAILKDVSIDYPGGDDLKRKLNFHMECLEKMGAKITYEENKIIGKLEKNFVSGEYTFTRPSVGATQHMILAAILGPKQTKLTLNNCSQEPECEFLINLLRDKFGAKIEIYGTKIVVTGNGGRLSTNQNHKVSVPPDRIEALTYLTLSLATNGHIILDMKDPLEVIGHKDLSLLVQAGGKLIVEKESISITRDNKLKAVKYCESGEYPKISTDFAPIFCALMGMSEGTSIFTENIYGNNRFKYIEEINKFGGVFRLHKHKSGTIVIDGSSYFPSEGICPDIRGGIAILLAALTAKGCSTIHNVYHIFRGYQFLIERINSLGGNIRILE